jgi:hypothetical protein
MINSIAACEDNSGITRNINFLFSKLLCRDRFQPYERVKIKLYIILATLFKIGRLIAFGPRLSNKDFFSAFGRQLMTVFYHVSAKLDAKLMSFGKKPNQQFVNQ